MEITENRMAVDSEWYFLELPAPDNCRKKLNGPGYEEFGTGVFVPEEDAFAYAMEAIRNGAEEEKQEFVEWFFSGNWIKEG